MTSTSRILQTSCENRIAFGGRIFNEDQLCEDIWLLNIELRGCYLSRREKRETKRLIAQYEALLGALRSAGP